MFHFKAGCCAAVIAGVSLLGPAQRSAPGALVVDDFESYSAGTVLAGSASSVPWMRFGLAINDQLYATSNPALVIDGNLSAHIALTWGSSNASANVRRNYVSATDLSGYNQATIKMRTEAASTTATVKLAIADGTTTYYSNVAQALSGSVQTFTFAISPSDMTVAAGADDLSTVLKNATQIGVRIENAQNQPNEIILMDDFVLSQVPEPASGSLLAIALIGTVMRRRRL